MSEEVTLKIDGREVKAKKGMTLLQAAKQAGIEIPTLCYHEKLEPYGACRICSVEIVRGGRSQTVVACVYPVEDGLEVLTNTEKIRRIRKILLELMLARAPGSEKLLALAREYGVERVRFEKEGVFCILCGLCVRYCAEVKGAHAIGFVGRGTERDVMFIPEIAAKVCAECKECFELCPTGLVESKFALSRALIF